MNLIAGVLTLAACSTDINALADEADTTASSSGAEGTSEESSGTSDEANEADTTTFVPAPDVPTDGGGFCDPFTQDCPDGEKCVPFASTGASWDANKCVPVTGDGQPGDTCTSGGVVEATDDCGADSFCWDVIEIDGQLVGTCTQFCAGKPDEPICPEQTSCLIANDGSITLCIHTCDPVAQDCGEGLVCVATSPDYGVCMVP